MPVLAGSDRVLLRPVVQGLELGLSLPAGLVDRGSLIQLVWHKDARGVSLQAVTAQAVFHVATNLAQLCLRSIVGGLEAHKALLGTFGLVDQWISPIDPVKARRNGQLV